MSLTEDRPIAPQDPDRRAASPTVYTVSTAEQNSGMRWVALLLLGSLAVGALAIVALILGALALSDDKAPAAQPTTLDLTLREFAITGELSAPAGEVILNVVNVGSMAHNIGVRELGVISRDFGPGASTTMNLGKLEPGVYELYCDLPGHEQSGMVAQLTVLGEGEVAGGAPTGGHGGQGGELTEADYRAMDEAMEETIGLFPAVTEGVGNPVLEATEVLADGTKVFDLEASIVDWEVEPGRIVQAWAYNGVVPAPQIILDRGDKVTVRLQNNLPMGTDIHWHGVRTPFDQDGVAPITQPLVLPGESFTYEFVATDDAIGMYHAHHHGQMQVINGLFGSIRVGDNPIPYGQTISGVTIPEDLEVVLDEPMVLNDAGVIGLSLNGKSFPATAPIVVNQGDWATITYYNEGLQTHPMHLHQFPQLVYAKDGIPLDHPYWADTVNVAPGERYTVLFRADVAGTWVWHCHILNHVEREEGMFGMVTAIVVQPVEGYDPADDPVAPTNWRWGDDPDSHSPADDGEPATPVADTAEAEDPDGA